MKIILHYKDESTKTYDHFELEKFDNIEEVIYLNCSRNNLISLPESIMNCKELKILNCFCNQIISIPQNITELKNLILFDIAENPVMKNLSYSVKQFIDKL